MHNMYKAFKFNPKILIFVLLAAAILLLLAGMALSRASAEKNARSVADIAAFLKSFGWQVGEPTEVSEVKIPVDFGEIYKSYNEIQKKQGFDLYRYRGERAEKYVFEVENYPSEYKVYATVLIYKERIIGGDLASHEIDGFIDGFKGSTP